jgi:hypothetical protein
LRRRRLGNWLRRKRTRDKSKRQHRNGRRRRNGGRGLRRPSVRVSFSCTPAPILKGFWPKALMKTLSSYLSSDYLELTD